MKLKTSYGKYEVSIIKSSYRSNNNLALLLVCDEGPFADISVNLDFKLPDNMAFVDTNNFPEVESFIKEYELGVPTGMVEYSGYCSYPLYEFDIDIVEKYLCKTY